LLELGRGTEATVPWREAGTAWKGAGDGPGLVEALLGEAALLLPGRAEEGTRRGAGARGAGPGGGERPLAAARALRSGAIRLVERGHLGAAREVWRAALALFEKLAPGSLDVGASLNNLGHVAGQQGDLAEAKDYLQRALAIREKLAP